MASRTIRPNISTAPKSEFPTAAEKRFLLCVYKYTLDHAGDYPLDSWLKQKLGLTSSGVSNGKSRLRSKGFLVDRAGPVEFTDKSRQYCKENLLDVVSVKIRIYGKVSAGRINHDMTEAIIEEWQNHDPNAAEINIPFDGDSREVFALQVVGRSMEHERIFEGDIVLVESFGGNQGPREGEMIVTYYLPVKDEAAARENPDSASSFMVGPVLKYFHRKPGSTRVILGWRNDRNLSPDTYRIETRSYNAVGRVIGVYRPIG
jgi:hypothetical protein